jgi:hypothetical protein
MERVFRGAKTIPGCASCDIKPTVGVWDTLIGVAAAALKEHPRKEVLMGLLELRDAMIACQKTYDDYQDILKQGDYDRVMEQRRNLPRPAGMEFALLYDPRESWGQTVAGLAEVLTNFGDILTIFSPEAAKHVRYYGTIEAMNPDHPPAGTSDPMDVLNAVGAGIGLAEVSLSSQFEVALSKLDEFIRQNFKPEEVFAAQKKTRPWPFPLKFCNDYWLTVD